MSGTPIAEANAAELDEAAATFRAAGVDAVTVMLLHSYANPAFEAAVADGLRARLPGLAISESAAIWPERLGATVLGSDLAAPPLDLARGPPSGRRPRYRF